MEKMMLSLAAFEHLKSWLAKERLDLGLFCLAFGPKGWMEPLVGSLFLSGYCAMGTVNDKKMTLVDVTTKEFII